MSDSLSAAFGQARSLVSGFTLHGMDVADTPEPQGPSEWGQGDSFRPTTASTNQEDSPLEERPIPPPETTDPAMERLKLTVRRETSSRVRALNTLKRRREAFITALRRLEQGAKWKEDFEAWAKESQLAQLGALRSSTGLLLSAAGPVRDAIKLMHDASVRHWLGATRYRERLERVNGVIRELERAGSSSPHLREACDLLRREYDVLTEIMRNELRLEDALRQLDQIGNAAMEATRIVEAAGDVEERHKYLLAAKSLQDLAATILFDAGKDWGLERTEQGLLRSGSVRSAQLLAIVNFVLDYGYDATRFWVSWTRIDELLARQDDHIRMADGLRTQLRDAIDAATEIRTELAALQAASSDLPRAAGLLGKLRTQRMARGSDMSGTFWNRMVPLE